MKIHDEIYLYATGEFLAKKDEFAQSDLDFYVDQASEFLGGSSEVVDSSLHASIAIHGLMLHDRERDVVDHFPDKKRVFADSDDHQVYATESERNLDYFLREGVGYEFDESQVERVNKLVRKDVPLSVSLIREKIVRASGFDGVRVNYIYHDVMDHVWLFGFMRDVGIAERYDDFVQEIGNPFHGSLMSRESELFSGIGFTSRRYLSNPEYYKQLSLETGAVTELLRSSDCADDPRINAAVDVLNANEEVASWAGYVIKATIANLLLQRERWGAVKRLEANDAGSLSSTHEVVSILDPRYISMIIETIDRLSLNKDRYISAQKQLNLTIEHILARYVRTGRAIGSIVIDESAEITPMAGLTDNIGFSTNYF